MALAQIYNPEQVEQAVVDLLKATGVAAFGPRSGELPRTRVEVTFEWGEVLGFGYRPTGEAVANYFAGTLMVAVVTPRDVAAGHAGFRTMHAQWIGEVIAALSQENAAIGGQALVIDHSRMTGTNRYFSEDEEAHISEIGFEVKVQIYNEAWPVD